MRIKDHVWSDNKNLQLKWDKWLIKGWYGFKTYGWVWTNFIHECFPENLIDKNWVDYAKDRDFLVSLNLKRCFLFSNDDFVLTPRVNSEVRGYIAERSQTLSSRLLSDKLNRLEILLDIDSAKWRHSRKLTKDHSNRLSERDKAGRRVGIVKRLMLRDLPSKHDWNITK